MEYIVFLRAMPVMPFGTVHVAAALFGVPLPTFVIGTAIGMIPCLLIYSWLGAAFHRLAAIGGRIEPSIISRPSIYLPLFALAALAFVPIAFKRSRGAAEPDSDST